MIAQCSLAAVCLAQLATAVRIQDRSSANYTSAPYSNSTSEADLSIYTAATASKTPPAIPSSCCIDNASTTASSTTYVEPWSITIRPSPIDPSSQNVTKPRNVTCTINIPDASVDWWFPATYSHPVATITSRWDNFSDMASVTFVPQTTSFEVVSAIESQDVCTSGWITYTQWDYSFYDCLPYSMKPTAASTAVVYRSAIPPIPTPAQIPADEIWTYDIYFDDLPSMTTSISVATNSTVVETMPTPFVHFTAYEVERGNSTETVRLSSVYVQSYGLKGIELEAAVTGIVPYDFMNQIPQSACDVGVLRAVVTVIIFVELYYYNRPDLAPGIVHWESSAFGWDDVPDPAGIAEPTSSAQLQILTDWNFPGVTTEPTEAKNTEGRNPSATRKPGLAANPSKETQVSQLQTAGTVGTAPVLVGPSSVVIVGEHTLKPGGPAVTVDGTPVALVPSATAIIVGGTSLPLPQTVRPGQQQTIGNFGTIPVIVGPSSVVAVGTQTIWPGGPAITIGLGTTVSLAPSGTALVIIGTTSVLPPLDDPAPQAAGPPVLTIGSTTLVPNAATQFFIGPGQTLKPGGTAVVDGVKVSLDSSAAFVVIGSSTQVLSTPGAASGQHVNPEPELIFGGTTITALPASNEPKVQGISNQEGRGPTFVISGQTLAPGGGPITVSGSTLSLAPSGSYLVIDGSTTTLATPAAVAAASVTPPTLTIGEGVFKPLEGTGTTYQIGTALLTPGGSVVVAGTTIALADGATALIVNGVTTTLATEAAAMVTNPPLLTIGSQTYTAVPGTGTNFVIGDQTLTPGGTITVDGTTIVLSPQATELVYGSSGRSTSTVLFPATTTSGSTTTTASPSVGQSGGRQAASTSSRQGVAPKACLPRTIILTLFGCIGCILLTY